ncbi:MAG: transporter substrate-binding protein [Massilia sp.]|jgi:NitT/TauT family transport system substrate-binding protein|nr:transporter substrate-binding protein [Massilia sp.]
MKSNRRLLTAGLSVFLLGALGLNGNVLAQTLEKQKVSIAVGGKNLLYYLPLTIAEQMGYFKDEGLQVEISDFAGGAKALQALVGGSADVVSGAYEHTINMQAKGQPITVFVLQARAPQIVFGVSAKAMPNYKSIADLKGKKIGVTAPGSSTNMMASFVLAKGGLKPTDVSFIGVGTSAGALSALRSGQIDAISNLDPVISMLQQKKEIRIIADARTLKDTVDVFGGPMPAASLYTSEAFLKKNPNTTQALANAMVRALKWIHKASPADIAKVVPESYQLGDRALYMEAFQNMREAISPDGMIPETGPATALRALQAYEPELAGKNIDLSKTYTNELVKRANAKYK